MTSTDRFDTRITVANDRLLKLQQQAAVSLRLDEQPIFVEALSDLSTALEELHVIAEELSERNAELYAARADLEAERQHYRDLFDFAPDGYLVTSDEGVILEANVAAAQLLQVRADFLAGKPLALFVAVTDRAAFYRQLTALKESAQALQWEVIIQPRQGQAVPALVRAIASRDGAGQVLRLRWMIQDISERQRTEAALQLAQKLDSLGLLAGGVAHDFNNLLVTVLAQTSLTLEQLPEDSPWRARLERVMYAAELAARLAQQMLDYSGRGQFKRQLVDLKQLLTQYHDLLDAAVPRAIALTVRLAAEPLVVEADPTQLQQIILNLVLNSMEAIGAQAGHITVEVQPIELADTDEAWGLYTGTPLSPGRYIQLEVTDTGHGMPPDMLPRVFDPFFSTRRTGRGLGLAVVLGIVRAHHGGLQVSSVPKVGTSFKIALPRSEAAAPPVPAPTLPAVTAAPAAMGHCVLIIDDEDSVREAMKDVLEVAGLRVLTAASGEAGLAVFQSRSAEIGLIVLDLSMPGLSGEETLRRLRALNSAVPVILSSGYDAQDVPLNLASQAYAAFLQKPYTAETLRAYVLEHLV